MPTQEERFFIASLEGIRFKNIEKFPHPTQMTVMPLVAYCGDDIRPVGTCFAISNTGIALTARHVLDQALGFEITDAHRRDGNSDWWFGALYASEDIPDGHHADLHGGILSATRCCLQDGLDIAVFHLNIPVNSDTGELLQVPALTLSPGLPTNEIDCVGLGYHSMKWERNHQEKVTHSIIQSYAVTFGDIEEMHFPFRDRSMLRFPCFRTSAKFDAGMSGGPLVGRNGSVIGVICSSYVDEDNSGCTSYGSLIGPALTLRMDMQDASSGAISREFLYDLAKRGIIASDTTLDSIVATRGDRMLHLDFGDGRTLLYRDEPKSI